MSIGPMTSIGGSVAGTALAQTRSSNVNRAGRRAVRGSYAAESEQNAELAAGIGQADGDNHQAADRDADGRRLWESRRRQAAEDGGSDAPRRLEVPDPTGQSGSMLDLSG